MTSWDLEETYRLVQSVFSNDQMILTQDSARSVLDRQIYSSYHFTEVIRLSKTFEKKHLGSTKTIFEIQAVGAEKSARAFQVLMVKGGAHSLAAVQSLHSIPDIFVHAIYFATGQNLRSDALEDSKIAVQSVVKSLKSDSRFG